MVGTHSLPSGVLTIDPLTISPSGIPAAAIENSRRLPFGERLATTAPPSTNHRLPSAPDVMPQTELSSIPQARLGRVAAYSVMAGGAAPQWAETIAKHKLVTAQIFHI